MKNLINGLKWNSLSPFGVIVYVGLIMTVVVFACVAIVV